MIKSRDNLFQRISTYKFHSPASASLDEKINAFESAIEYSVKQICEEFLTKSPRVHLAYSGGVDSSIILIKILRFGFPLTTHTIASTKEHPDIVHSNRFIKSLKERSSEIEYVEHILASSEQELQESNEPDNYYMLMQALAPYTTKVICCDCIDELMGGYYSHQNPKNLPVYDKKENELSNRTRALVYHMAKLISNHLSILDRVSSDFGITVELPYGNQSVMENARIFTVDELVDKTQRKKPVYIIAKRNNIPPHILERKKYGLCSALNHNIFKSK